jgi:hypothetical protein
MEGFTYTHAGNQESSAPRASERPWAGDVVRDLDRDDRPGSKRQTEPRYLTAADLDRILGDERRVPPCQPGRRCSLGGNA